MRIILLLILTLPLLSIAEEDVVDVSSTSKRILDLTYNLPIDYNYCKNNPVECRPLPSKIPKFDIVEHTTTAQWTIFWTFQVLDAYSTSRAVKYDCIREINPLYTERPSDTRIVTTKTLLLAPALLYNDGYKKITPQELDNTNTLYLFVVANNFRLLNDAKDTCNKIR